MSNTMQACDEYVKTGEIFGKKNKPEEPPEKIESIYFWDVGPTDSEVKGRKDKCQK